MGVIEDGTASGHLPSKEVFAVHFPAYPSSMSRAMETLGGPDAIAKVRSSKQNKLELRFRPEDPSCHPAFGQIHSCSSLLLRISKINSGNSHNDDCSSGQPNQSSSKSTLLQTAARSSDNIGSEQLPENSIVLSADIVARVHEAYHFTGMVDYQHVLPVHASVARRKERDCDELKRPSVSSDIGDPGDEDDENLMIYVPPLFSLKDVPENLVLRPSLTVSSKKKREGVVQQRWEAITWHLLGLHGRLGAL